MRGFIPLSGFLMSKQNDVPQHTYRFPFRINMPLLILFWDAKKLGLAFILVAFGNIFECFGFSVVAAVVYWIAYNKAAESGIRGLLKHKLWRLGFLPGKAVFSSRYFNDPFIRDLYS
ncbi:type IV conjugative transfer system protein TraL [Escherichia coli]|uniref:type IV conjugative transfer system protein TraL n=1 Tax=Escherichia coli TaxID=562 RepID=UPI00399492EF